MKTPSTVLLLALASPGLFVFSGCNSEASKPAAGGNTAGTTKKADPSTAKTAAKTVVKPDAKPQSSGAKYTAKDRKAAKAHMKLYCSSCHGLSGKGDGPAGIALNPKPRNWTDGKWQDTVTDEKLFGVIKEGGAKHGLSPLMAPNPSFQDRPGVIWALVKLVRGFRSKG